MSNISCDFLIHNYRIKFGYFQGDSGGPLICRSNKVAGILSRGGEPCDNPAHPPKFTNIGFYKKWINEKLRKN